MKEKKRTQQLCTNIHLRRWYPMRDVPKGKRRHTTLHRLQHQQQQGRGLGSLLRLAIKVVKNPIVKQLGREALSRLPDLCSKGTRNLRTKN